MFLSFPKSYCHLYITFYWRSELTIHILLPLIYHVLLKVRVDHAPLIATYISRFTEGESWPCTSYCHLYITFYWRSELTMHLLLPVIQHFLLRVRVDNAPLIATYISLFTEGKSWPCTSYCHLYITFYWRWELTMHLLLPLIYHVLLKVRVDHAPLIATYISLFTEG